MAAPSPEDEGSQPIQARSALDPGGGAKPMRDCSGAARGWWRGEESGPFVAPAIWEAKERAKVRMWDMMEEGRAKGQLLKHGDNQYLGESGADSPKVKLKDLGLSQYKLDQIRKVGQIPPEQREGYFASVRARPTRQQQGLSALDNPPPRQRKRATARAGQPPAGTKGIAEGTHSGSLAM